MIFELIAGHPNFCEGGVEANREKLSKVGTPLRRQEPFTSIAKRAGCMPGNVSRVDKKLEAGQPLCNAMASCVQMRGGTCWKRWQSDLHVSQPGVQQISPGSYCAARSVNNC